MSEYELTKLGYLLVVWLSAASAGFFLARWLRGLNDQAIDQAKLDQRLAEINYEERLLRSDREYCETRRRIKARLEAQLIKNFRPGTHQAGCTETSKLQPKELYAKTSNYDNNQKRPHATGDVRLDDQA
jgi:hypothetical protein